MSTITPADLILNPDGSIYHLGLKPEQVADVVLLVGDPGRVEHIKRHFSKVEFSLQKREFVSCTGYFKGERITVLATGIGTDNIEIVLQELDALVNIDLAKREPKTTLRQLQLVRIGTCGSLQNNIAVESPIVSAFGLGMDGLMHYYCFEYSDEEKELLGELHKQVAWNKHSARPYVISASDKLFKKLSNGLPTGITVTAPGFYAPQGRTLRFQLAQHDFIQQLINFRYKEFTITNFEMETSALYGLARLLGHEACTVCLVIANRATNTYTKNPYPAMEALIRFVLERLTQY